jgi:Cu/Ag efflux pump CusA
MAVPAVVLAAQGSFNTAAACAFVAVTGMAVNASVLLSGEIRETSAGGCRTGARRIYRALRKIFPTLAATAGTTLAGALPFLFLREDSNAMMKTLAMVTVLGVGSSSVFSVLLIPGFFKKDRSLLKLCNLNMRFRLCGTEH